MTALELASKWEQEATRFEQYDAQVDGARLCRAMLADFGAVLTGRDDCELSLAEAAALSGYSKAHLMRLVSQGRLVSLRPVGSKGRLGFRQGDLPRKPGTAHTPDAGRHELASRLFGGNGGRHGRS
jgi:hypothetical protein